MSDHEVLKRPERLEHEVESIRENLSGIVTELDHRRHELLDVRLQLRRHGGKLAIFLGVVTGLVGLSIFLGVRRRRREAELMPRMRRMRRALARFVDDPERVVPAQPGIARKALAAAAAAMAATLGKKVVGRAFEQVRAATTLR